MIHPDVQTLIRCAKAVDRALADHESEIEGLDRAIGDGDHYLNIKRGAETIVAMEASLATMAPDAALKAIALKLMSTIGGASGPLIASFFLAMSKACETADGWDRRAVAAMVAAGVAAIQARGKAALGEKTMLDVLIPVSETLSRHAQNGADGRRVLEHLPAVAEQGMLATRDLLARRGRAAFLGERALGHIDPGSKSSAVIIASVCATLQEEHP